MYSRFRTRGTAMILVLASLTACAGRTGPELLATVDAPVPPGAKLLRIYAATTREHATEGGNSFNAKPAVKANYARYEISVPAGHRPGEIEWPSAKSDPRKTFAVLKQQGVGEQAFFDAISKDSANKDVGIFIHGYNVNYPEALYRLAQMSADANIDGVPVLFSWPSQATISGYVADKEAVTYSRDDLARMLVRMTARRGSRDTIVFAHSMGGWLLMEALRQLRLQGRDDVVSKLRVFLAAPDIDENVFRAQLAVIGKMKTPITILVSKDDLALKVSSLLTADSRRVGAIDITDPEIMKAAQQNGLRVVDISEVAATDSFKHSRYAGFASIIPRLEGSGAEQRASIGEAGAFVFDAVGATISSPFRLASQIVAPR